MNGIKEDPDMKMEDEKFMDDEFYEDTGELTMPRKGEPTKEVWLTRIPEWLYAAVSNWDDLSEGNDNDHIQIGEVMAQFTTSGIDKSKKMGVFLNDRWRHKYNLPTAFTIEPGETSKTFLANTYVFTEKDLPGFKPSSYGHGGRGGYGGYGATQDPKARVQKRSKYKKAIPKQTSLVGHATQDFVAIPCDTSEYRAFGAARVKQAVQGSYDRTVITDERESTTADQVKRNFAAFIKPPQKGKSQQNKAIRVSREELIDMLHLLFDEHQYWPMRAIKGRTKQPESFLKEVLPSIAQLIRSGVFNGLWQRMEVYNQNRKLGAESQPDFQPDSESEDEMEDVV